MKIFESFILSIARFFNPEDIALKDPIPFTPKPVYPSSQPIEVPTPIMKTNREHLYDTAFSCIGTDASPLDAAPDEYGCADSVNQVYHKAFNEYIQVPGISTAALYRAMILNARFQRVSVPLPGDIIISPTGSSYFPNTPIPNGHVGIVGKNHIMSNNSLTGKWDTYYTLMSWDERYKTKGGYPTYFFRRVGTFIN